MKARLKLEKGMKLVGYNEKNLPTYFDTHPEFGGEDSAPTPMEVVLRSLAGCTAMDILSMLRKRKKTVSALEIFLDGDRSTEHPKAFTKVTLMFHLVSEDTSDDELKNIISLSQDRYCSVAAMFKKSGCEVLWDFKIFKP